MERTKRVEDGTVMRFKSYSLAMDREYTYAAIFIAGFWWLTGVSKFFGTNKFSHAEWIDLLTKGEVKDLEVAVVWEAV
jgi:hypothetical protein